MGKLRKRFGGDDAITTDFVADDEERDRIAKELAELDEDLLVTQALPGERRRLVDVIVETLERHQAALEERKLLNELNKEGGSYPSDGFGQVVERERLHLCIEANPHRLTKQGMNVRLASAQNVPQPPP
jgi:hypothetical protein